MNNGTISGTESSVLERAMALDLPSREAMLHRSPLVQSFWNENQQLLSAAWGEWEALKEGELLKPDDSLLDSGLRDAVNAAWEDPTKEIEVEKLWDEVSPGVYQCQFFNPDRLAEFREYLDAVQAAGIPLRPPYGIALNRFGAMLDQRSEGYLAAPSFQGFYSIMQDHYMRPIARLLFPEIVGYDTQTFGFSIQYQPGIDTSLQLHSDASAATLNINLNLPDETFTGSEVDFYDPASGNANRLSFEPGMAMIHKGTVPHAARPITSGKRTNFVLWLYGDRMQLPRGLESEITLKAKDRWSVPTTTKDNFAPF